MLYNVLKCYYTAGNSSLHKLYWDSYKSYKAFTFYDKIANWLFDFHNNIMYIMLFIHLGLINVFKYK